MKKIFIKTFGCTLNQKDSEDIIGNLSSFSDEKKITDADLIIVNTCGVKEQTEQKILKYLKEIKQKGIKEEKIIITGCLVTINDTGLKEILPNAKFFKVEEKEKLKKLLNSKEKEQKKNTETIIISNGCLGACSYCAVKFARGTLKSKSILDIKKEVTKAIENNTKEILLTSQDTGCYGFDINTNIVDLLKEIIKIPGDFKIRLGMANPKYLLKYKEEISKILNSKKMYKFLHIPIQSGNDEILKKMNRPYTVKECEELITYFKKEHKELTLSTDIIVGFPTETEEQFKDTLNIIKKLKFDVVNISRFGQRKNIEANKYPDLPGRIKKERSRKTTILCKKIALENNLKYLNKIKTVRVVGFNNKDTICRTKEYKQVILVNKKEKIGKTLDLLITDVKEHYLLGSKIEKQNLKRTDLLKKE